MRDRLLNQLGERQLQQFQVDLKSTRTDSRSPEFRKAQYVPDFVRRELTNQVMSAPMGGLADDFDADEDEVRRFYRDEFDDPDWSIDEVSQNAADEFDVNEGWAFKRTREWLNSLVTAARMKGYSERGSDDALYHWQGPDDGRNHPACEWLRQQTSHGVPLDRFFDLIQTARNIYVDDPPKNPYLVHDFCRHQIKRKYDR